MIVKVRRCYRIEYMHDIQTNSLGANLRLSSLKWWHMPNCVSNLAIFQRYGTLGQVGWTLHLPQYYVLYVFIVGVH